jgi:hypothetical protein
MCQKYTAFQRKLTAANKNKKHLLDNPNSMTTTLPTSISTNINYFSQAISTIPNSATLL